MLYKIEIDNVGCFANKNGKTFVFDFHPEYNFFFGPNGSGKTFVLDVLWWTLTNSWAFDRNRKISCCRQALPGDRKLKSDIKWVIKNEVNTGKFYRESQSWITAKPRSENPSIVIYAMADGSYGLFNKRINSTKVFNKEEILNGSSVTINGFIRDLHYWQLDRSCKEFVKFEETLNKFNEFLMSNFKIGKSCRISLDDCRDIPTLIAHNPQYADIPVTHMSSGFYRILSFAYVLNYLRQEEDYFKGLEQTEISVLLDDVESSLDISWHSTIVNAIMAATQASFPETHVQCFFTTKSTNTILSDDIPGGNVHKLTFYEEPIIL